MGRAATTKTNQPLPLMFTQESCDVGQGTDGYFGGRKYFECAINRGLFVSLDKLRAAETPHSKSAGHYAYQRLPFAISPPAATSPYLGKTERQLMVEQKKALRDAEEKKKKEDKAGAQEKKKKAELERAIAETINVSEQKRILEAFEKEKKEQEKLKREQEQARAKAESQHQQSPPQFTASAFASNPHNLRVGSAVQISATNADLPHYGEIKWIGSVPGALGQVAGIELVRNGIGNSSSNLVTASILSRMSTLMGVLMVLSRLLDIGSSAVRLVEDCIFHW